MEDTENTHSHYLIGSFPMKNSLKDLGSIALPVLLFIGILGIGIIVVVIGFGNALYEGSEILLKVGNWLKGLL